MHPLIQELAGRLPKDCEDRVMRAKQQYNLLIRKRLMHETRLNLQGNRNDERIGSEIQISIVPGYPAAFEQFNQTQDEDYGVELLGLWEQDIESLSRSSQNLLPVLLEIYSLHGYENIINDESLEAVDRVGKLSIELEKIAKRASLAKKLFAIQEDIMGIYRPDSYSPDSGQIQLYWLALGICAELLRVPVEHLTAVVMIHELAHGYTHLGKDIDNYSWDTELMFRRVDGSIVEGLAQYYTDVISQYLGDWENPGIHQAYLKMRRLQSGRYRIHESWVRRYSPEVVRISLLKFRRDNKCSLPEFESLLGGERDSLGIKHPELHPRVASDVREHGPHHPEVEKLWNSLKAERDKLQFLTSGEGIRLEIERCGLLAFARSISLSAGWKCALATTMQVTLKNAPPPEKSNLFNAIGRVAEAPESNEKYVREPLEPVLGIWGYAMDGTTLVYSVDRNNKELCILGRM